MRARLVRITPIIFLDTPNGFTIHQTSWNTNDNDELYIQTQLDIEEIASKEGYTCAEKMIKHLNHYNDLHEKRYALIWFKKWKPRYHGRTVGTVLKHSMKKKIRTYIENNPYYPNIRSISNELDTGYWYVQEVIHKHTPTPLSPSFFFPVSKNYKLQRTIIIKILSANRYRGITRKELIDVLNRNKPTSRFNNTISIMFDGGMIEDRDGKLHLSEKLLKSNLYKELKNNTK
jgi:hypothetical protein